MLLMAAVHIAHDCIVKDNVIMANMSTLGGHVEIQEYSSLALEKMKEKLSNNVDVDNIINFIDNSERGII